MANCVYHPGKQAIGACVSCFTLVCKECSVEIDGNIYCKPCQGEKISGAVDSSGQVRTNTGFLVSSNTSGQGRRAEIPSNIRGWNWGAMWGTWIWGIANRVWISLLYPVPFIMYAVLVVLFVSETIPMDQMENIAGLGIWRFSIFLFSLMQLVLHIALLLKGNQWAWQAKRWDSVQSFLTVQKRWTLFFLILFILGLIIFVVVPVLFIMTMAGLSGIMSF
ncbi:B-box zinc finger protein [Chloroflexota bacterium]